MAEVLIWMLFGGFMMTCLLYLALTHTEDDDEQQH
jgi:hypothetical protein